MNDDAERQARGPYESAARRPPSARCTTRCCSRRCGSSSIARRSTRSRRPSPSPDVRLAIEPSANPAALIIRWFGTRYTLRVPGRWLFTAHEVRLAQAIGAVLAARYRAILNPQIIAERGDLFRGAIEDRYVGAFLDHRPTRSSRARRAPIASRRSSSCCASPRFRATRAVRFRPACCCSSTGRGSISSRQAPSVTGARVHGVADGHQELLPPGRRRSHAVSGQRRRPAAGHHRRRALGQPGLATPRQLQIACARAYQPHARATMQHGHVCAVLTPSREIKLFAEGVGALRVPRRRLAPARPAGEVSAVGGGRRQRRARACACFRRRSIWRTRARARCSWSSAIRRSCVALVAPADRLDMPMPSVGQAPARAVPPRSASPARRAHRPPTSTTSVLAALASLDGATVVDRAGRLLAAGAILRHPPIDDAEPAA